jgi:REP element-mobilizing transposase RayT
MARQRHYQNPVKAGICVFVTTTILDFVQVFREPKLADLAIRELALHHRKKGARLHAFVIMPEHIHFLSTLPPDQNSIAFVGRLKTRLADEIIPRLDPLTRSKFDQQRGLNRRVFWQRSFRGLEVEGQDMFWQKAEYIHLNPVRRELVLYPEDYRWSSARLFLKGCWDDLRGLTLKMEDLDD